MATEFSCQSGTFSIDECLSGQSTLPFYDPLKQIALRPDLRTSTVLCYNQTSVEGLFAQLGASLGADKRTVKTNPFYWTEYCQDTQITVTVKRAAAASSPGGQVVLTLSTGSHSVNGKFSGAQKGYRAYIKERNGQAVDIEDVNRSVTGAFTITVRGINNEVVDLTKYDTYTLLVDPLRMYIKNDDNCIVSEGYLTNPPSLRKAWVQKFEKSYCVKEDELDGYAYDVEFSVLKGLNPKTGKMIEYFCPNVLMDKLMMDWIDSRVVNTLFGQRDDVKGLGFDALIPTARRAGMYNRFYDPASGVSLKQILFGMIRNLRKTNGCNEYMLLHDHGFGMDWSDAIGQLIAGNSQQLQFSLFGKGGGGVMNFDWFQFKNFSAFNYKFSTYQIDAFDNHRYGNYLTNFALMMPACKFKDTSGNIVPAVTYVVQEGCEPAKQKNAWSYDFREQGCRQYKVFLKDEFGMEIHCPSKLGLLERAEC